MIPEARENGCGHLVPSVGWKISVAGFEFDIIAESVVAEAVQAAMDQLVA